MFTMNELRAFLERNNCDFYYVYGGTGDVLHTLKINPADVVRLNNVVKHLI